MPIKVKSITPEFIDSRGYITRIIDQKEIPIRSILIITSKKLSKRAFHYHKKDFHFVYCLSGKMKYSEKDIRKKKVKWDEIILKTGELVLTKPMIAHKMEFIEDTVLLVFTTETRDQVSYERDTIRFPEDKI